MDKNLNIKVDRKLRRMIQQEKLDKDLKSAQDVIKYWRNKANDKK